MPISPLTIYLWQLADRVNSAAAVLCFLTGAIAVIVFTMGYGMQADFPSSAPVFRRLRIFAGIAFPLSFSVSVLTPSSDTIAMMVVIPKIAESSVVQKDIPELYNVAIEALKNQLKGKP